MKQRQVEILSLNSGSSSLKFAVFEMGDRESMRLRGAVEGIGLTQSRSWVQDGPHPNPLPEEKGISSHREAAHYVLDIIIQKQGLSVPAVVGHRIVHGGMDYAKPQRVDARLIAALRKLIPLAPLHLPAELEVIQAVTDRFPEVPQVACFDTEFHRALPELAQRFALPRNLWDEGIRRYGFHGLSYEYILSMLRPRERVQTIIAHLGNGASLVAVKDGRPLETTMGLTPIGGVMMGTRSGDLDPGILLYLLRAKGYDAERLDRLVQQDAGLRGVSEISSDMKVLLERREQDARAAQAIEMFCYSVRKSIGALAAVLGGLQTLVFTGGIGERAAPVRSQICEGLEYLGVQLDARRNADHADVISTTESRCSVRVIPTDEDLMVARHSKALLTASASN